jgi:hypothetical protein
MPETQIRLLPAPQPLVERFGPEFFRAIPRRPGVYRMFDASGALVYVGKALDLRARLASYRRTHGQSRKTVRLIHAVHRLEWEECESDTAARLLENELIRSLRPRFNRAGTWPASARFVVLETLPEGFRLTATGPSAALPGNGLPAPVESSIPLHPPVPMPISDSDGPRPAGSLFAPEPIPATPPPPGSRRIYGAFRGGPTHALASLARLLWLAWHRSSNPVELPHALVAGDGLKSFEARHPDAADWRERVHGYFAAESDDLLAQLVAAVPEAQGAFARTFLSAQFECLADFYRRGPLRTGRLRTALAPGSTVLAPEQLDDFSILAPLSAPAPAFRPAE